MKLRWLGGAVAVAVAVGAVACGGAPSSQATNAPRGYEGVDLLAGSASTSGPGSVAGPGSASGAASVTGQGALAGSPTGAGPAPLPGKIVFSSAPINADVPPASRARFDVGEPIYAEVFLDAPMRGQEGPDLAGTVTIDVATATSSGPCMATALHGDAPWEARVLAARAFSVDVVRPPFPSRVREPDVRYAANCLDVVEDAALAGRPMTITIRVETSTWQGRVKKTLAVGHASIEPKDATHAPAREDATDALAHDDATHALAELYRSFSEQAILPASIEPQWNGAAIAAVKAFARERETTSYEPIAASVAADPKGGHTALVVFKRPDGTCFAQPDMLFDDNRAEVLTCRSDAQLRAVRSAVQATEAGREMPELDAALAEWEVARKNLARAVELHEHYLVTNADVAEKEAEEAKARAALGVLAPATKRIAAAGECNDALRLKRWPARATSSTSTRARSYDLPCANAVHVH